MMLMTPSCSMGGWNKLFTWAHYFPLLNNKEEVGNVRVSLSSTPTQQSVASTTTSWQFVWAKRWPQVYITNSPQALDEGCYIYYLHNFIAQEHKIPAANFWKARGKNKSKRIFLSSITVAVSSTHDPPPFFLAHEWPQFDLSAMCQVAC